MMLVLIGALVGGAAIVAFERHRPLLEQWLRADPARMPERFATVIVVLLVVTTVSLFVLAAHLWRRGTSVRRSQRFPLADERLIRDTPVVRSRAAAVRGHVLHGFAIGLAVIAGVLAMALWRLATAVTRHAL
jgi:hypothetical protein